MTIDTVKLRNISYRIEKALDGIREASDGYRTKVGELKASKIYEDGYRASLIKAAKDSATEAIRSHRQAALDAKAELTAAIRAAEAGALPDGIEGVAARVEAADARQRVRGLLERGTDPRDILRQGAAQADRLTLEALRVEAAWLHPNQGGGIEGAPPFDPTAFVRRIDEALVPLVPEDHAELKSIAADLHASWPTAEIILGTAEQEIETGPTLATAVALRMAAPPAPPATAEEGDAA